MGTLSNPHPAGGKENRKKQRIQNQYLPQPLKSFTVAFEDGTQLSGETIDASESGIAFQINVPVYNITDFNVTLTPADKSFSLQEEIVYIKPVSSQASRASIHFSNPTKLDPYLAQLRKATRSG
ncbi:MAG: PilZ domain-containing protein [Spirochaetaceae bacterium]|nr:MAG: PilZ domain-containing protein [Spirochaetaceae bacterium]